LFFYILYHNSNFVNSCFILQNDKIEAMEFTKISRRTAIKIIIFFAFVFFFFYVRGVITDIFLFGQLAQQEGNYQGYISSGGLVRSYILHLPAAYDKDKPVPLVLVLHGAGANAEMTMKMTGMNEVSEENVFIALYPNGTGLFNDYILSWNAGECCNYVEPLGVDDVGFIRALVNKIQTEYNIDSQRIYAAGISNGGMMAYKLGCDMADVFAAIAPVSARM